MIREKLTGVGVAMITPFTSDGRVDYQALARMIDYVIEGGVDYIVAGENMGPAKLKKAEKLGVKIISEEDFIAMIGSDEIPAANAAEKRTEGSEAHKDAAEPELF